MKNRFSGKLIQFAVGVWKVVEQSNLFVVRNECGRCGDESFYRIFLRKDDPWDTSKTIMEFDSMDEACKFL